MWFICDILRGLLTFCKCTQEHVSCHMVLLVQSVTPLHLPWWHLEVFLVPLLVLVSVSWAINSATVSCDLLCQWHHMTKKLCCMSFQLSLPKECSGVIDDAVSHKSTPLLHDPSASVVTWTNQSYICHFYCLDLRNIMVPLFSCDANADATMPMASHDTNTSGVTWIILHLIFSGVTLPEKLMYDPFW